VLACDSFLCFLCWTKAALTRALPVHVSHRLIAGGGGRGLGGIVPGKPRRSEAHARVPRHRKGGAQFCGGGQTDGRASEGGRGEPRQCPSDAPRLLEGRSDDGEWIPPAFIPLFLLAGDRSFAVQKARLPRLPGFRFTQSQNQSSDYPVLGSLSPQIRALTTRFGFRKPPSQHPPDGFRI